MNDKDGILDYFSTVGRAGRGEMWGCALVPNWIASMIGLVFFGVVGFGGAVGAVATALAAMGSTWVTAAATVRRLQDLDRPGWHVAFMLVPVYNLFLGCQLFLRRGTVGDNQHGPDPLEMVARRQVGPAAPGAIGAGPAAPATPADAGGAPTSAPDGAPTSMPSGVPTPTPSVAPTPSPRVGQ